METEERTRFEVLLENIQTNVKVIAEGHGALTERLDRMDGRFDKLETRFDKLETRFDVLENRFNGLENRFDVFANDTQQRLKRIESHVQLNGSNSPPPRQKATRNGSPKRRKQS